VIPQRIKLRGFLCYVDEQEVEFDSNSTLWMLSGLNGSGKSSIFDALTYALFGHHRGGGQHAHELINKDSDTLLVEFDFQLDNRLYRAKRTLRRKTTGGAAGTQQMFWLKTAEDGTTSWVAIEGTGQKKEFDAWVAENIGLNYDTFTSSVLLLQGKAEKLLDSKPEGRREVLASIVDLERYERLHQKADEERKGYDQKLKLLHNRLLALPAVSEEELTAARQRIEVAEKVREEVRAEVERFQGLEFQAKEWAALQMRLGQARKRWQDAEALLNDAADIEQDMERLHDLRETLPHMEQLSSLRTVIHQAQLKITELGKQRQKLHEQLAGTDSTIAQTRTKRDSLQRLFDNDERGLRENSNRLLDSTARMEKLREYERQEGECQRIRDDLTPLPPDPAAVVREARERCEQLSSVALTVRLLERFQSKRESLRQAGQREQAAQDTQKRIVLQGQEHKAEFEKRKPQLEEAAGQMRAATDEATAAKALLQQARDSVREITNLDGSHRCRACGQPLTAKHLADEKRRRNSTVKECDKKARETQQALEKAQAAEEGIREQYQQAEKRLQDAREDFVSGKKDLEQAQTEVARLRNECQQAWEDLPETQRLRIGKEPAADWLKTTYPSETELRSVRAEAGKLTAAKQSLLAAEKIQEQWTKLKSQESSLQATLQRLRAELPPDHEAVRRLHTELQTNNSSLEKSLAGHRAALKENADELDRLTKEREKTHQHWVEACGLIKQQEDSQRRADENVTTTLKLIPATWQSHTAKVGLVEIAAWQQEQHTLETNRVEERGKALQHARHNLEVLKGDYQALDQEQEKYPAEARQEVAAIQVQLTAVKARQRERDAALGDVQKQLALLENDLQQRRKIEAEYVQTEGELATQRLLAELLGRERLQLYLVRQAERQVVEHANAVLDRLSGGQLYLKLVGVADGDSSSGKALDLEAFNRSTGEKPINVAFLSGSQKFRVAVSLALGIGQYASRQHRPIEAVIIDEGFGCLDNQGRQVMIQELQNLRGQMRCILLVSHQEDFAEAFTDGYHFKLDSGRTKVTRFQR
jgi:DNA repair protein SbcC/Rad50